MLHNRMVLDVLTAALGGICSIIQIDCHMYILSNLGNITTTLQDMIEQVQGPYGPTLTLTL